MVVSVLRSALSIQILDPHSILHFSILASFICGVVVFLLPFYEFIEKLFIIGVCAHNVICEFLSLGGC